MISLNTEDLRVEIDPGRGADFLAIVDRKRDIDVLFRTPWRDRADAIRAGQRYSTSQTTGRWLESYRGGWQTLCPNAGDAREIHGGLAGYHGEASIVPWSVDAATGTSANLHVELFSLPLRIERSITVDANVLKVEDVLTNLSREALEFDYSHHPALGGQLLDSECVIQSGARRFTSDSEPIPGLEPGATGEWPFSRDRKGVTVDLREVPGPGEPRALLLSLEDFAAGWASVSNAALGLVVKIEWDAELLPFAWVWQELNHSPGFPWFGRARALAIEPASAPASGPARRSSLRLSAYQTATIPFTFSLESTDA